MKAEAILIKALRDKLLKAAIEDLVDVGCELKIEDSKRWWKCPKNLFEQIRECTQVTAEVRGFHNGWIRFTTVGDIDPIVNYSQNLKEVFTTVDDLYKKIEDGDFSLKVEFGRRERVVKT
jgi:hypothetical protein